MKLSRFLTLAIPALICANAMADERATWDGVYVSAGAGVARGDASWRYLNGNWANPHNQSIDGSVFNLAAGYQKQFDKFVIGAEIAGTASAGNIDGRATCPNAAWVCNVSDVTDLFTIGPKVGYAISDKVLVYVHAAYANGEVKTMSKSNLFTEPTSKRHDGWAAGVGADYALTNNVSIGAKYSRVDLGTETHTQSVFANDNRNIQPTLDVFTLNLNYAFR